MGWLSWECIMYNSINVNQTLVQTSGCCVPRQLVRIKWTDTTTQQDQPTTQSIVHSEKTVTDSETVILDKS